MPCDVSPTRQFIALGELGLGDPEAAEAAVAFAREFWDIRTPVDAVTKIGEEMQVILVGALRDAERIEPARQTLEVGLGSRALCGR
jgi:hypothetical protein